MLLITLKMKKKIINFRNSLSPNFSYRKKNIKYIVLHYTGTNKLSDAIKIFKNPESKVSCHWLISSKGILYKIVEEKNVAWHAGISYWKKEKMLNDLSIGIELENKGHGINYSAFPRTQMKVLEKLLEVLLSKYRIKKQNVLAHSDIAPQRKFDPGELFNWSMLAKKNLVYWPIIRNYKYKKKLFLQLGDNDKEVFIIKKMLNSIGYNCSNNYTYDISLKLIVEAFQRRFSPEHVNGIIDHKLYYRIKDVSKNA